MIYLSDVVAGDTIRFDVWTDTADLFELNYDCEDIDHICVKFEKGDAVFTGDGDDDFLLTPNPKISCKVLSCGRKCIS